MVPAPAGILGNMPAGSTAVPVAPQVGGVVGAAQFQAEMPRRPALALRPQHGVGCPAAAASSAWLCWSLPSGVRSKG